MRFHEGRDGWGRDSYEIPDYAVVGSSDCGMASDSPARTESVLAELEIFRKALLAETGIRSRIGTPTQSGNVFMIKQWVVVERDKFNVAAQFALLWLSDNNCRTHHIHCADQKDLVERKVKANDVS